MRRQRRAHYYPDDEDYRPTSSASNPLLNGVDDFIQLECLPAKQSQYRFENTIEAKVEDGDTLQALALRFHCTVADIKRLNKIDKDNEIHARKVVKIPVTVHSVLLGALPQVHKSGNNSPRETPKTGFLDLEEDESMSHIMRNPLETARLMLDEKLMIASVNAGGGMDTLKDNKVGDSKDNIKSTILNSKNTGSTSIYTDEDTLRHTHSVSTSVGDSTSTPLLDDILGDEPVPQLHRIRGPSLRTIDWSGSDCDMSWVCLLIMILALCFIIPLVYVFYLMEHGHHHNTTL